ncbi:unnamed protein product, partial [Notodromas monacha]
SDLKKIRVEDLFNLGTFDLALFNCYLLCYFSEFPLICVKVLRDAQCVIHSHSKAAVMATLLYPGDEFTITGMEMIKYSINFRPTKAEFVLCVSFRLRDKRKGVFMRKLPRESGRGYPIACLVSHHGFVCRVTLRFRVFHFGYKEGGDDDDVDGGDEGIWDPQRKKNWDYDDTLRVPIIENTRREHQLTDSMRREIIDCPWASAVLVRRHGFYVWGPSWKSAKAIDAGDDEDKERVVNLMKL